MRTGARTPPRPRAASAGTRGVMSDGRLGVVLDGAPDLPSSIVAGQAGNEVQRHVDAGAHAGGGDDVAVVDPAVVLANFDARVERTQLIQRGPVRRRWSPAQQ